MRDLEAVAKAARQFYEEHLRDKLEATHMDAFCAIEPVSGDYFLGQTLSDAARAARHVHPDRTFHTVRIGHAAAIQIGSLIR